MNKTLANRIFGNAFNLIPAIGAITLSRLLNHFGSFESAWFANPSDYLSAGIPEKLSKLILESRSRINPEKAFAELARRQIEVLLITEPFYPTLLKEIHAAPPLLYIRGRKEILNQPSIGVVGTRKISPYGKLCCDEFITGLVQNNLSIISGLAFGVDAQALNLCIDQGGSAVAVLASDLDDLSISPKSNFQLAQKIIQTGCLVSEYALGSLSHKQNFPVRNRIISGLSLGTLVIEADLDSGSLITANYALEQNREVFAIPGPIFAPGSRGTNQLLKKGAKLVTSTADIMDELNLSPVSMPELPETATDEEEKSILSMLTREGIHIDEIIKTVKLTANAINAKLTILEMKNRVKNLGGGYFAKLR
jgi:DNA processing protein